MRIVVFFLLVGLMQPVLALTKCEFKRDKTLYKKGICPRNAVTSYYLVKDKYVREELLEEFQQERVKLSEQAYKRIMASKKRRETDEKWFEPGSKKTKPAQMKMSDDTAHFNLQNRKPQAVSRHKINAPKMYDGVNDRLSEMERKLEAHKKELQQLEVQ